MSPKALEKILKLLPVAEHETAKRRIAAAEAMGWRQVGVWTWDGKPTVDDLAAVCNHNGVDEVAYLLDLDEPGEDEAGANS